MQHTTLLMAAQSIFKRQNTRKRYDVPVQAHLGPWLQDNDAPFSRNCKWLLFPCLQSPTPDSDAAVLPRKGLRCHIVAASV